MSEDKPQSSPEPISPHTEVMESHNSGSVMMARIIGILCVAGGFVLGIQALDQPESHLLPTALGFIVAGLVAQVFALVRSWYLYSQRKNA